MDMFADLDRFDEKELTSQESGMIRTAEVGMAAGSLLDEGLKFSGEGVMESRLNRLEDMLSQLLLKDSQHHLPAKAPSSPFSSDSEDETVMLVGLRTIQALVEEGKDPKPLYKHLEFMAKKASMCRYKYEAFSGYNCRVRDRAGIARIETFAEMSSEDVATFFCAENMIFNGSKSSKKGNDAYKKRSSRICLAFNETGCSFKACNYSHICLACEDQGHDRKDCPVLKQRKSSQK